MKKSREKQKTSATHKMFTVIGIILCVVLLPILAFNLTLIIKGVANPKKVPTLGGIAPLIVLSGSMENDEMEPNIRTGDLIFIKGVNPDELKEGDIIAFMEEEHVISHRIIRLGKDANGETIFFTKGDNPINSEDQNPVKKENVIGIYSFKIAKLGDFAMFLQTPLGMILFIGLPFIILVLYDVIRYSVISNKRNSKTAELEEELKRLRASAENAGADKEEANKN